MRGVKIFSGSSHPALAAAICERLGLQQANCELTKFSNGETSVSIGPSIRNQDVFIVQSGSKSINDSVMELLIMASACKGGSAKSITAVVPYFPYSRQSKKKSHRGAITARMLANLLQVAGVTHVITVDLHATPMQGFFACPVDNLRAELLIARWIRKHVPDWQEAVVVSKNAGGSKRVTSMADVLKLNFGIITTDRRRNHDYGPSLAASVIFSGLGHPTGQHQDEGALSTVNRNLEALMNGSAEAKAGDRSLTNGSQPASNNAPSPISNSHSRGPSFAGESASSPRIRGVAPGASPLSHATSSDPSPSPRTRLLRSHTAPLVLRSPSIDETNDERARDVIQGRLIQGHIVDEDYPSPALSSSSFNHSGYPGTVPSTPGLERADPMGASLMSRTSSVRNEAMGGQGDGNGSEDDEASLNNPEIEHTITLVGNVKDRTVLLVDDMIDRSEAWVAAAETVRKRGDASKVFCIATHGLFGENALEEMEDCDCIDYIIVCNTFPIEAERIRNSKKLIVLDLSGLLSEAIRRTHYGESISQMYQFFQD